MNARETALQIIRIEFATHGTSTLAATRAYVENQIGAQAYLDAQKAGMWQYAAAHADQERR